MKRGVLSTIDFDLEKLRWLRDALVKILRDKWGSHKLEFGNSLIVQVDSNCFGDFIRIIEKNCDSLFVPEGRKEVGIENFLIRLSTSIKMTSASEQRTMLLAQVWWYHQIWVILDPVKQSGLHTIRRRRLHGCCFQKIQKAQ
ncbi:unnamed protein product [Cuscuta epithymum]|uniref:Uncharacterized protein n=1 Tax=Cuscuta epithymum TaxID=186058 RepID=A0AAV0EQ64_9ASTE|nr:unnamed protein product [Cuscuta epithymum]